MASPAKIPVWLDCDPGHDDSVAILFAAYHPLIDLLGVSTVHGNSSVAHTTLNAGSILTCIGKPEIPVYQGAAKGLVRPPIHAADIHGESGIDGTDKLPVPKFPPKTDKPAIDALAEAILATPPNTSWIIATGAMTNVAMAMTAYPQLISHIKGFSLMGGAIGGKFTNAPLGMVDNQERFGNFSPYAEFNIIIDPEAAFQLFTTPELAKKTVMIPLDLTHQVLATPEVQELLAYGPSGKAAAGGKEPSTMRQMYLELMNFFAATYARVFDITAGPPLHDPLAVAVILDGIAGEEIPFYDFEVAAGTDVSTLKCPEVFPKWKVDVVTEGTHEEAREGKTQTGRTIVSALKESEDGIKIPKGLNVQRFWTLVEECMQRADEKNAADAAA